MTLSRIVLGVALALTLGSAVEAAEVRLSEQQLDRVTAAGPRGDSIRAAFARLALAELQNGFSGGPRSAAGSGINVIKEYVLLEIMIRQNGY